MIFRTFTLGSNVYSVDLMFSYVNIYKPTPVMMDMKDIEYNLYYTVWNDEKGNKYKPIDVILAPKKYKYDMDKIKNADLSYPIIVHNGEVIDGFHRLTAAKIADKKKIKAYIFTTNDLKKFIIDKKGNVSAYTNMEINDLIELFNKRMGAVKSESKKMPKSPKKLIKK